ncbi:TPA: ribonuclease III [bacterium]|jgi:ribonuclease-3|nr:ribonuclease III [bacterium]
MELKKRIDDILNKFDLKMNENNYHLYKTALTHSSYVNEKEPDAEDYQRLEFVGDAVLELAITELIYKNTNLDEGNMSFLRQKLVKEDTIAKIAIDLGIDELILIGLGEDRKRQSLLADVFESVLGAIFLDQGYKTSLRVVRKLFFDLIKKCQNDITQIRDPKSLLYEYIQTDSRNIMKFVTIRDQILPNNRHLFEVEVVIDDVVYGRGKGHSKSEAEQQAAKDALSKIAKT